MRKLVEERTGASANNQFYHLNPRVDDIPEKYGKSLATGSDCLFLELWKQAAAVAYVRSM